MQYVEDVLSLTVIPATVFDAFDLVGYDGSKITTNDAPVLGVAKNPCTVVGTPTALLVLGVARLKAVGAISAGQKVVSALAGGVKYVASPVNVVGYALASVADGEFVDILIR